MATNGGLSHVEFFGDKRNTHADLGGFPRYLMREVQVGFGEPFEDGQACFAGESFGLFKAIYHGSYI